MCSSFSDDFKQRWRRHFESFAATQQDDAGIAGWSTTGLQTRLRFFHRVWNSCADKPKGLWLDAGCGAGTYSRYLASTNRMVLAVDYSEGSLRKAQARDLENIRWVQADATKLPLGSCVLDGVICLGVSQAVPDSEELLHEVIRVLKPGGQLWVDGLNRWCPLHSLEIIRRRLGGLPVHLRYESPWQMLKLARKTQMCDAHLLWMPILPEKVCRFQWFLELRAFQFALSWMPLLGALVSHSFLLRGVRNNLKAD
jgi:ubiquinone/menaquinone biosynthesis C-methylase UbiE